MVWKYGCATGGNDAYGNQLHVMSEQALVSLFFPGMDRQGAKNAKRGLRGYPPAGARRGKKRGAARPVVAYLVAVPIVLFPLAMTGNRPLSAELGRSV
jgi:hypothetical protein